ncbi:hypothetical protein PsYK624_108510 [Phanerochaete sordida]|uniref:Uncharacterized protein n=1 Tax=Phanerochaete sordida TaxID=48140 RepID=A0A9P3GJD9_9APHY|nr:hypothetical protein PsYK624_108510 [Phanerochaete sordida]
MKTYRQLREARRLHISLSLSACLFRDGTIYFVVILIVNILRLFISTNVMLGVSAINALIFKQILIQRFLINLRHIDCPVGLTSSIEAEVGTQSATRFAISTSRIGNIGDYLADSPQDESSDDLERARSTTCTTTGASRRRAT